MKHVILFPVLLLSILGLRAQSYNIGDYYKVKTCNATFYDAGGPQGFAGYAHKITLFHADSNCLQVTFSNFDLGFGGELKIYKGAGTAAGNLFGTYSGTNMPPVIIGQDLTFEYIPPSFNVGNLPGWAASLQCVDCSLDMAKSDPASDCPGAIPLCANSTVIVSTNQYTDIGSINDEVGSCFSGTGNGGSVWYTFQPQTSGNLDFSISPTGGTDYDFVLYDATNGCGNLNEMSCNYSADYGVTGITTNSSNYTSSYSSCSGTNYYSAPASCGTWNQAAGVTIGHTYMLMVNFYGGSNNGFTLHFQNDPGTVSIMDNIPPTFATATQPGCNGSSIHVTFSENINCTTMQSSDFTIPGYTVTIANSGCASGMTLGADLTITPPLTAGSHTLHGQTMNDMCGNPMNDDITFTITNATVTVTVTGNDPCQGSSSTLTATTTGSGTLNYNWSNGGSGSTTSVSTAGNYCVTVSDLCTNSASDCMTVTVLPAPTFNVSTSCDPTGTVATLTENGCTGTFKWNAWDTVCTTTCIGYILFGNCIGTWYTSCDSGWAVIGTTPTITVNAPFFTQYMASCTGSNGCETQQVFNINCNTTLSVSVNSETICSGGCTDIYATVNGGVAPLTYTWDPGTLTGVGPNNVCPTSDATYTVTVSDAAGNTATASGTVTVGSSLTPVISGPTSFCTGFSTTLDAGAGYSSYTWSTTETTQTITVTAAGTYTVSVSDASGCSGTTSVVVTVNTNLTPTITGPSSICTGSTATLDAGNGYATYTWSTTETTQTISVATGGTYTVTVSDASGCSGTASFTLSIGSNLTLSITPSTSSICSGASVTLTASGGATTYSWSPATGLSSTTDSVVTASPVVATTYTVTGSNASGCSGSATATVSIGQLSTSTYTTAENCGHGDGTATVIPSGGTGNYTYLWSNNQTTPTATGLSAGTYSVTVNDGHCTGITSVVVTNIPGPTAGFSANPVIASIYNPVSFISNSTGNIVSWGWNFGDGSTGGSVNEINHQYTVLGTYPVTLFVTDINGCTDSVTDTVWVKEIFTLYIPNAMTPDEDGLNDGFSPRGINVDPNSFDMYIFDRWGKLFFHTSKWNVNSGEPWNGTLNNLGTNNDIVVGEYVYRIVLKEIGGVKHEYLGGVAIIK